MKKAQAIRITLLLAVIFAAGAVTGRLTAPRPPVLMKTEDGRVFTSEQPLMRLKRDLHLSADQESKFRPLLEEMAREMSPLPPASNERLAKFKGYLPQMKALLREEQYADFDRYVRVTEARFRRAMRARTQPDGPPA